MRFRAADARSRTDWHAAVARVTAAPEKDSNALPSDAQVIGAVQRVATKHTVAMCAAGTMPGALQVLWQSAKGGYHMEYGYSCMGYEVAGAMGIKLAAPEKEVICFVGDGSYMMANSELATAVMRRVPFTIVLTDNRGYGCINRLQIECGGAEFNNMYKDSNVEVQPEIDFVAHAASMGAHAEKAVDIADLEARIVAARGRDVPSVIVIDTDAVPGTGVGGHWWDVAVPEVGGPERLEKARERYHEQRRAAACVQLITAGAFGLPVASYFACRKDRQCRSFSASLLATTAKCTRSPRPRRAGATSASRFTGSAKARRSPRRPAIVRSSSSWSKARPSFGRRPRLGRPWRADGRLREDAAALPLFAQRHRLDGRRPRPTARSLSAPRRAAEATHARRIGPDGITLTERGKGTNTRHINNIAMENEDWCDSLLVTEVFTPAGHWSSYPSHRHDEDDFPRITYLEETYYHRLNPKDGFGIQRVYTDDGSLDETMAVAGWRRRAGSTRSPPLRRPLWLRDVLPECHGGSPQEMALRSRSRG